MDIARTYRKKWRDHSWSLPDLITAFAGLIRAAQPLLLQLLATHHH